MKTEMRRTVREELLRSFAWFGLALVGWQVIIDEVAWLEQSLLTVFGLPVLTWAVLTAGMIGTRVVSGRELQHSESLSRFLFGAIILGVPSMVYLIVVEDYSPLLIITAEIVITAASIAWFWYAGVFESSGKLTG